MWSAIESITLSTADVAEIRVAHLLGSNKPGRARYCAHKALFVGTIVSAICTITIWLLQSKIARLFTKNETLQQMITSLMPFICVGNITLMFGNMSWAILGSQGRFSLAAASGFFGSWAVTLPLATVSTFIFNIDLQGLVASLIIGFSCSGALNTYILTRSNWEKIADEIQQKNRQEEEERAPQHCVD